VSSGLDDALFDALAKELQGRRVHATQVEQVEISRDLDADGSPALFVHLTLSDPPAGAETWPSQDVLRLRQLVRDAVLRMLSDDGLRWYVSFDSEAAEISSDPE
jgi:hypothetical protein